MTTHLPARLTAALAVAVTALAVVAAVVMGGSHPAAATTARPAGPFVTGTSAGATVAGMTEYEAEDAHYTGTKIGPDYTQGDLATEASGRQAVQLTGQGQYVEFTLTAEGTGTRLHLVESGFASLTIPADRPGATHESHSGGWPDALSGLRKYAEQKAA